MNRAAAAASVDAVQTGRRHLQRRPSLQPAADRCTRRPRSGSWSRLDAGADLDEHGLGAVPLRELPITVGRIVLVVAQVLAELSFQSGLEHGVGQAREQVSRADQPMFSARASCC